MDPCESSEPSLESPSLLDLGGSLYPVLLALDAEDLARLAQCCVALRSACEDDSLWRALCAQHTPTAAAWRDTLRLGSYRHTYLVLCWLGVRPGESPLGAPPALTALRTRRQRRCAARVDVAVARARAAAHSSRSPGLWVEEGLEPYGDMPLVVTLRLELGCLELLPLATTPPLVPTATGTLCRLRFGVHNSRLCCDERWSDPLDSAPVDLLLQLRRQSPVAYRARGSTAPAWRGEALAPLRASAFPPPARGARRILPDHSLCGGGFFGPSASKSSDATTTFRLLPSPAFAPSQPPPGASALTELTGLYFACYGPHCYELLHVRWHAAEPEASSALPADLHGPGLLLGTKVTGDPNVPCAQLSFAARVSAPDGAFAADRPAFTSVMLDSGRSEGRSVELGARRRAAACELRAAMQINMRPGIWEPRWIPACLLVYRPGAAAAAGAPPDTAFSLLTGERDHMVYLTDYRAARRGMFGLSDEALLEL